MQSKLARTIAGVLVGAALLFYWLRSTPPSAPSRPNRAALVRDSRVPATAAPPPLAPAEPSTLRAVSTVDVCGYGQVPLGEDGAIVAPEIEEHAESNMARWQQALANGSDIRARAVGLYLASRSDGEALDSLVQLAQQTRDPAVYALSLRACKVGEASALGGLCEQISLQGWAKLEPDNAAPWLYLVSAARSAGDAAAENAAFANAARATKSDAYNWSLLTFAEADMPGDLAPLDRWEIATHLIGIESGLYAPHNNAASRHCSADRLRDEIQRHQCDQMAQLLVTQATTLLDYAVGTAIGKRVGWSADRLANLDEELQALQYVGLQAERNEPGEAWSCAGYSRRNRYMHTVAQLGEMGAAREASSLSSNTRSERAAMFKDSVDQLLRSNNVP